MLLTWSSALLFNVDTSWTCIVIIDIYYTLFLFVFVGTMDDVLDCVCSLYCGRDHHWPNTIMVSLTHNEVLLLSSTQNSTTFTNVGQLPWLSIWTFSHYTYTFNETLRGKQWKAWTSARWWLALLFRALQVCPICRVYKHSAG